jgi:hypothetical protein
MLGPWSCEPAPPDRCPRARTSPERTRAQPSPPTAGDRRLAISARTNSHIGTNEPGRARPVQGKCGTNPSRPRPPCRQNDPKPRHPPARPRSARAPGPPRHLVHRPRFNPNILTSPSTPPLPPSANSTERTRTPVDAARLARTPFGTNELSRASERTRWPSLAARHRSARLGSNGTGWKARRRLPHRHRWSSAAPLCSAASAPSSARSVLEVAFDTFAKSRRRRA